MQADPFPDLKIDSAAFLDELAGRSKCSKCGKSRKYYCFTCYLPVPEIVGQVPNIRLPLKVDIIKHPGELDGKSTAIHAGVIAPEDVTIYTYPVIPDYDDKTKVVIVFPGKDAVTLDDLAARWNICKKPANQEEGRGTKRTLTDCDGDASSGKASKLENTNGDAGRKTIDNNENCDEQNLPKIADNNKEGSVDTSSTCEPESQTKGSVEAAADGQSESPDGATESEAAGGAASILPGSLVPGCPLERVVFVDSTWNQTKTICSDERLKGLTHVELHTRTTQFWRHQHDNPATYLATIEAIYYFLRDAHELFVPHEYAGQYDNLLFFFRYMHGKIRSLYDGGENLKAYKARTQK